MDSFARGFAGTFVQGVGFLADAYDLFIINIVVTILAVQLVLTPADKAIISAAVIAGTIVGQLLCGVLADRVGRRPIFVLTLLFIVVGALWSALVWPLPLAPGRATQIVALLACARSLLGVGIGGEYPLAATITGEQADARASLTRGRRIAVVFSMQGVGALLASLIGWVLLFTCGNLEVDWRVALGLGVVPAALSVYPRAAKLAETSHFFTSPRVPLRHLPRLAGRYWRRLVGTAGNWLLLDVVFYANGLFSATLLREFGVGSDSPNVQAQLAAVALFNVILSACALPGYFVAAWLIELPAVGRRGLQLGGFVALALLYLLIGALYERLASAKYAFMALYSAAFFVSNVGANTTTFVLPAELFPTRLRASFHGLSAACGKVGALIGAYSVAYLVPVGVQYVFYACGTVSILGALLTYLTTEETRARALNDIAPDADAESVALVQSVNASTSASEAEAGCC